MVKRLAAAGLLERPRLGRVVLTAHGMEHAVRIVLLEAFLARTLRVPWDEAHEEAEVLEHAFSERLIDRIDDALGIRPMIPASGSSASPTGTVRRCAISASWASARARTSRSRIADPSTGLCGSGWVVSGTC